MAKQSTKVTERTTKALRDMLFDEIDDLRSGEGNPTKSLAVSRLAGQIINIARAEMDFRKQFENGSESGPRDLLAAPASASASAKRA